MAPEISQRLTPEQPLDWQRLDLSGRNLIEASAGTGKTYTLVLLVMRLLLERELPLGSILLSTFTEAATAELRARVSARIEQAYRAALPPRDADHRALDLNDPLHSYLQRRWQIALGRIKTTHGKLSRRERDLRLLRAALLQSGEMAVKTIHGFCHFVLTGMSDASSNSSKALLDAAWLNDQAIDDAIRRRFVDVQVLDALQADCLDRNFLNELRRSLKRILMYGRLSLRAVQKPDLQAYERARAELFTEKFSQQLQAELSSGSLALRADTERAAMQLLRAFRLSPQRALPHRALKRLAGPELELVNLRQKRALSSFACLTQLRDFARLAMAQRQAHFGDVLHQLATELRRLRRDRLQARDAMTYDSMIENLATRLDPVGSDPTAAGELAASIRRRFPVALIDEFQDTDEQQWAILRAIYADQGGLLLVGDPKQAIYRFRGSDVHTFIRAKQYCACFYLNHNFRARPLLLAALTHFYQRVSDAFFSPDVRFRAPQSGRSEEIALLDAPAPVAIAFIESPSGVPIIDACQHLAQRVRAASMDGQDLPKTAMLLARRIEVHFAQRTLLALGISAHSGVSEQITESPLAECLRSVLPALLDPNHLAAIRNAWVQLGKCTWFDAQAQSAAELLQWASTRLHRWQYDGIAALVMDLASEVNPDAMANWGADTGVRWETDAKQLAEYLADIWAEIRPRRKSSGASQAQFLRDVQSLLRFLEPPLLGEQAQPAAARHTAPSSVQLLTVHAAKGLEFDEVYLPSLQFFHEPDHAVAIVAGAEGLICDVGSPQFHDAIAEEAHETLRERLRLQYVALTRARDQLYIHFKPSKANAKINALDWHLSQAAPALDDNEDFADQLQRSDEGAVDWRQGLEQICRHPAITSSLWQAQEMSTSLPATVIYPHSGSERLTMPALLKQRAPRLRLSFSSLTRSPHDSSTGGPFAEQLAEVLPSGGIEALEGAEVDPEIALLATYKGPGFGQALHTLFELALARATAPSRDEVVASMASAAMQPALQASEEIDAVEALLARVLHAPLRPSIEFEAPVLRLADVLPEQCLVELGFYIPINALALPELARLGESAGLGSLFIPEADAGFSHVDGALVGFIDLIFQHAGRFFILDYKSNFLGARVLDYSVDALGEAMSAHFYHLQHLIYALALHRYLRASLPGYCYASHFGGVHYVFVRAFGLASERDEYLGDYYFRAPEDLINALDRLLRTEVH